IPSKEIRERVDMAIETVGMTEYMRHEPHRLSGGQKQRVAIAGVIVMKPMCMILDEATAMLDPIGRREVMNTVKKFQYAVLIGKDVGENNKGACIFVVRFFEGLYDRAIIGDVNRAKVTTGNNTHPFTFKGCNYCDIQLFVRFVLGWNLKNVVGCCLFKIVRQI
ncbi:MAG: ATP-binding cassette domain-containing protein, partial [Proteobacteria bacterium]|nr:ATP-binding cassette domain-containing protein [Pseudomonadota bacterium]